MPASTRRHHGGTDGRAHRGDQRIALSGRPGRHARRQCRPRRDVRAAGHAGPARRHEGDGGRGPGRAQRPRPRTERSALRVQQRRPVLPRRPRRVAVPRPVPARPLHGRSDPDTRPGDGSDRGPLHRVRRQAVVVAERPRLRHPWRLLLHRPRPDRRRRADPPPVGDLLRRGRRVVDQRGRVPRPRAERDRPVARRRDALLGPDVARPDDAPRGVGSRPARRAGGRRSVAVPPRVRRVAAARLARRRHRRQRLRRHDRQRRRLGGVTEGRADRLRPHRRPDHDERVLRPRRPDHCLHHLVGDGEAGEDDLLSG